MNEDLKEIAANEVVENELYFPTFKNYIIGRDKPSAKF